MRLIKFHSGQGAAVVHVDSMKRLCYAKWNRTVISIIGNTCACPANMAAVRKVCTLCSYSAFCHIFNRFPDGGCFLFISTAGAFHRKTWQTDAILQYEQMSLLERHQIVRNGQDQSVSSSLLLGSLNNQAVQLSPAKCSYTEVIYESKHHAVTFREKSVFLSKYYCTQTTHQSEDKHIKQM